MVVYCKITHCSLYKVFTYLLYLLIFYRTQSEVPAMFNVDSHTQKSQDPHQLGVVAGPFGQMLHAKDQNSSRRGSQYSVGSNSFKDGKLYVLLCIIEFLSLTQLINSVSTESFHIKYSCETETVKG